MSLSIETSTKIKYINIFSMLLVLYIHSGFHANELEKMNLALDIQEFISGVVGRIAVPFFFIFSGYLFFLNGSKTMTENGLAIKKRIRTLLIPYLIGCLYFVLFFAVMSFIPVTKRFINSDLNLLRDENVYRGIVSIFWKAEGMNSPLAFQLWYLRDLLILIVSSPLINITLKYGKVYGLFLFTSLIGVDINSAWIPSSIFISLFWFGLGSMLSYHNIGFPSRIPKWATILFIFCYFFIAYSEKILFSGLDSPFLDVVIILLGVTSFWYLFDYISDILKNFVKLRRHILFASSFSFFIYLFHEPSINVVRKLIVLFVGKSEFGYALSYLASPFLFYYIGVLVALFIRKNQEKLYSILVGGRV